MAAPKAPVLGGSKAKEVTLEESVFGAELKPHLVHETVRAELNAARAGTQGGEEPRARRGRPLEAVAPEGNGSRPRRDDARTAVDRRRHGLPARDAELRRQGQPQGTPSRAQGALDDHAKNGTFAVLDGSGFEAPSTRKARSCSSEWSDRPTLVVTTEDEDVLVKSFRNLEKVLVTVPAELEVVSVVWARSVLVSEAALPLVLARAGAAAEKEEAGQ